MLARWTDSPSTTVGVPVACRDHERLEGLIGCFINVLALRVSVERRLTFRELLARSRDAVLGGLAHAQLPFELLVEALQPPRSLQQSPLFQVMLTYQNVPGAALSLPGLSISPFLNSFGPAKIDLSLAFADRGVTNAGPSTIAGSVEYDAGVFDAATVERLAGHDLRLLAAALADPDAPLDRLELVDGTERELVVDRWSRGPTLEGGGERGLSVAERIAARAAEAPSAPAVVDGDGAVLSYGELLARADALAGRLRALGVGPGRTVGLGLGRSAQAVVAIVAAWRAGAAYVPLDLAHPSVRLAQVLADARPAVLLVDAASEAALPAPPSGCVVERLVLLHAPAAPLVGGANDAARPRMGDPAHVIYTSGSTVAPKGVVVTQGALGHLLDALDRTIYRPHGVKRGLTSRPLRVGLSASLAFDASVKQLVLLGLGHALVVVPEAARRDPEALVAFARAQRLDALDTTPSQLHGLLAAGLLDPDSAPSLLLVGGEAVPPALWEALAAAPATTAWNVYGPTECTVDATAARIRPDDRGPNLGRPLPNVTALVLDRELAPAPIGVVGELYLGGAGLARGYLRRPGLTAERFVPHPFASRPGERLYRVGDRARWQADGTLEYLGRADRQVKVRGHRVELGEVEAALRGLPGVADAAVLAEADPVGGARLVGYVVPTAEPTSGGLLDARAVRAALQARLPEPLVPAAVVVVELPPLTPNGKLDAAALRALPPPSIDPATARAPVTGPRGPLEELVAAAWAEVLGLDAAGLDRRADVFGLGGHSLAAARVAARLRVALERPIPLRWLFEAPTVAGLAARLGAALRAGADAGADGASPPVPADGLAARTPAPGRVWCTRPSRRRRRGCGSLSSWSRGGGVPPRGVGAAARAAGRRGVAARRGGAGGAARGAADRVPAGRGPAGPGDRAGGGGVSWLGAAGARVRAAEPGDDPMAGAQGLAAEIARAPFDLARGPLLRTALVRLGPDEHVLVVAAHHLAVDGWSVGQLLRELGPLYAAAWQGAALGPDRQAALLAYWRGVLGDGASDGPVPPLAVPAPLAGRVRALAAGSGATPYMALLAGYLAVLGRWAEQDDLAVGTPVAGGTTRRWRGWSAAS